MTSKSMLPAEFAKIVSALSAFPTQGSVIKLTLADWEAAYKANPTKAWLDLAAGGLNLFSQYNDVIIGLKIIGKATPAAIGALMLDLTNGIPRHMR